MNQLLARLSHENEELRQQNKAQITSVRGKVRQPDPYDGKEDPVNFLASMDLYFRRIQEDNDDEKVTTALEYLRGPAAQSFQAIHGFLAEGHKLPTWHGFKEDLVHLFSKGDPQQLAINELESLTCSGSIPEYIARFRQLTMLAPDYSEFDLRIKFIKGLPPKMRNKLLYSQLPQNDLNETVHSVIQLDNTDNRVREFNALSARHASPGGPPPPKNIASNRSKNSPTPEASFAPSPPPDTMDWQANVGKAPSAPRAGNDTRKCYNCNEVGHISAQCSKPRRPRQNQMVARAATTAPPITTPPAPPSNDTLMQIMSLLKAQNERMEQLEQKLTASESVFPNSCT